MALTSHDAPPIAPIDGAAMLGQVEAWCAINTGTGNLPGLARQWDALADAFAALPGTVSAHDPAPVQAVGSDGRLRDVANGRHLVMRVRPAAARRILLTGHMDTVYPPEHPFQDLRWIDGDTLNAPGAADMKGGLAVMLHALLAFEHGDAAADVGYDVMINADEETGSRSSAALIDELAAGKVAALTYEPAAKPDGTLAHARGGSGNFAVVITGRSAHAGRNPDDGRNALVAAADLALRLKALHGAGLSVNPARIEGGAANNVVPDNAVLHFNIRPQAPGMVGRFDSDFNAMITELETTHKVAFAIHGGVTRPPKPVDGRAQELFDLVRRCGAQLGQTIGWQATGGVCDGNNIAARQVPVVDTMGVRGGAIHSPDEYCIVPSLVERARLSAQVLHRIATGALA